MFFIAKLKTVTALVFVAAAFGLGTGGMVYQTRVGAADPDQPGSTRADAAEARDTAEALRKELAKVRQDLEVMRAEAERQRQRAEEALKKLEAQLDRAQAEKVLRLSENELLPLKVRLPETPRRAAKAEPDQKGPMPKSPTGTLPGNVAAKQPTQNELRRQYLLKELKELDDQEKKQAQSSADKLDRILELLERLEKRLERLERAPKEEERRRPELKKS
jgi:hypothetical protein